MPSDVSKIQRYLLPAERSFWKWSYDGEVICWKDGTTIVFRAELVQILQRLAPMGLPSLSSLLLVLSALRDEWNGSIADVVESIVVFDSQDDTASIVEEILVGSHGLGKLSSLPKRLRGSTEERAMICQVVFERVRSVVGPAEASEVVEHLEHSMDEVLSSFEINQNTYKPRPLMTLADLRQLERGLQAIDADTIDLRLRTSLDVVPQPAEEIELPQSQQMRGLLDELQHDQTLEGVAKLARQLMAALSLPRKISDPDDVPTGGISDISNRGSLDRLMLTELAHDDLTLAVRISSNEALYLRRESPPQDTWREFTLLLDAGIRMWGLPRVYATAVAMALVANADQHTTVRSFRAKQKELAAVDLLSREGIVTHLEALQAEAHPGDALAAFAETTSDLDESNPVLLTTQEVVDDRAFQEALAAQSFRTLYLVVVQRDGSLRLEQRSSQGRKILRQLQLDLDVLTPHKPAQLPPPVEKQWANDLPAIFAMPQFPLLCSVNVPNNQLIHLNKEDGVIGLTKDRRLIHWHKPMQIGAKQLADDLPASNLQWCFHDKVEGLVYIVLVNTGTKDQYLLTVNLHHGTKSIEPFPSDHFILPLGLRGGVLLAQEGNLILAYDLETCDVIDRLSYPTEFKHSGGRFFRNPRTDQWCAASYDGRTIRFENVFTESSDETPWLTSMIECDGVEGPIGITHRGEICFTESGELWDAGLPRLGSSRAFVIAQHGSRICIGSSGLGSYLVDLQSRTATALKQKQALTQLFAATSRFITPTNVRHRFTKILLLESEDGVGRLALTTRRGQLMVIDCDDFYLKLRFPREMPNIVELSSRSFSPLDIPEIGYELSRAAWPNGSEAFLDSRGMLHLRSANGRVPEVTIVLTDGHLAGWTSEGRVFGQQYFTGNQAHRLEKQVFEQVILGFVRELL
ncbi:hypothetical protein ACYFX5_02860 [Bremerella sp. T1]|uniref:hypothetical protein n=1 Tax=Bremerella sp. TYQ1 TaxID=3119568 RepID=UPI001CC9AE47|nr:hypothetical protein [Bremerella volcania]UBM37211.1 hypothetical protein LA756_04815 [Bremerella volcania]